MNKMQKKFITALALLLNVAAFSQVGIQTQTPQATLDVVGKPDVTTVLDGIIAPRIEGAQLRAKTYTSSQTGTLVYVTVADTAPAGQTIDVKSEGYYYFNGTKWIPGEGYNIYNANGTLTNNRVLSTSDKSLEFNINSLQRTFWSSNNGSLNQMGLPTSSTKHASINLTALDNNSNSVASNLYFQIYPEQPAQIIASNDATGLSLSTNTTTASAPIRFITSAGAGALGNEKMRITGEGRVAIGTSTPTEKFHITGGNVRIQNLPLNGAANAINTTPGGSASPAQDQTFEATRTLVADKNGIIGYVEGVPGNSSSGNLNVGETISATYSVPNAIATSTAFNLNDYVVANSLPALPVIDGLRMDVHGRSGTYYEPRIYNTASETKLVSYQTFATQVNENKTSLNNTMTAGSFYAVDNNEIVYWSTSAAEVITTNLQVQVDANTYKWYEFKWWCMEVSGEKKIFLSVSRKA